MARPSEGCRRPDSLEFSGGIRLRFLRNCCTRSLTFLLQAPAFSLRQLPVPRYKRMDLPVGLGLRSLMPGAITAES